MKAFQDFRKHPLLSFFAVLGLGLVIGFGLYGFMNYIQLGGTFTPSVQDVAKTSQATVLPPSHNETASAEATVATPTAEDTTSVTVPAVGTPQSDGSNNSSNQNTTSQAQSTKPNRNPVACVPVVGQLLAPKDECEKEN